MAAQGPGLDQKPPCVHIPVRKVPLLLEKSLHNRNRGAAVWSAFRKLRHVVPRAKRCLEDILAAPSSGRVPGWDVGAEVPSLPPAQRADPTPLVAPSWLEPTCCGRVPRSCPALPCPAHPSTGHLVLHRITRVPGRPPCARQAAWVSFPLSWGRVSGRCRTETCRPFHLLVLPLENVFFL